MSVIVRLATKKDIESIKKLLSKGNLNTEGIEQNLKGFLVVEETKENKIVGTAGIEIRENNGLLRSLAMASESWNIKIGLELIRIMLSFAKTKKVKCLYLLSGPSFKFFQNLGFRQIEWEQLPPPIKESDHMKQYQPEWMKIMAYDFPH